MWWHAHNYTLQQCTLEFPALRFVFCTATCFCRVFCFARTNFTHQIKEYLQKRKSLNHQNSNNSILFLINKLPYRHFRASLLMFLRTALHPIAELAIDIQPVAPFSYHLNRICCLPTEMGCFRHFSHAIFVLCTHTKIDHNKKLV